MPDRGAERKIMILCDVIILWRVDFSTNKLASSALAVLAVRCLSLALTHFQCCSHVSIVNLVTAKTTTLDELIMTGTRIVALAVEYNDTVRCDGSTIDNNEFLR